MLDPAKMSFPDRASGMKSCWIRVGCESESDARADKINGLRGGLSWSKDVFLIDFEVDCGGGGELVMLISEGPRFEVGNVLVRLVCFGRVRLTTSVESSLEYGHSG